MICCFTSLLRLRHADRFDVEVRDEIRDDRDPGLESVLHLDGTLANLAGGSTWGTAAGAKPGGVRRPAGTDRRPDIDVSLARRRPGGTVRSTAIRVHVPGHRVRIRAQVEPLAHGLDGLEDLAIGALLVFERERSRTGASGGRDRGI